MHDVARDARPRSPRARDPYHAEADSPWRALLAPDLTRVRYADQLARAYGFEQPLEAALQHTPYVGSILAPRTRSGHIKRDLFALDYGALAAIPRCLIAPFPSLAEAFGWLYVIERSARMHAMIAGHVLARLPQLAHAVTYLADDDAQNRWRQLGTALDRIAWSSRIEDQVIAAAHTGMRTLCDWYAAKAAKPAVA